MRFGLRIFLAASVPRVKPPGFEVLTRNPMWRPPCVIQQYERNPGICEGGREKRHRAARILAKNDQLDAASEGDGLIAYDDAGGVVHVESYADRGVRRISQYMENRRLHADGFREIAGLASNAFLCLLDNVLDSRPPRADYPRCGSAPAR